MKSEVDALRKDFEEKLKKAMAEEDKQTKKALKTSPRGVIMERRRVIFERTSTVRISPFLIP